MTLTEALLDYLDRRNLALDRTYMRAALRTLAQALMESEVGYLLEAARYERNQSRRAYRNGYRQSTWITPAGNIALQIPKLRKGTYYPHFLDDEAVHTLVRLVHETFVGGVADLGPALSSLDLQPLRAYDLADIVERLADAVYNARHRRVASDYTILFLDVLNVATEHRGRQRWRQVLVALGIQADGQVDFLAHEIVLEVDSLAWMILLRRLRQRGLKDVDVVLSDHYEGVRAAVEAEMVDAVWRHHRHFLGREGRSPLVDAVSDLVIRAASDDRNLPRMHLAVAEADCFENYSFHVVA